MLTDKVDYKKVQELMAIAPEQRNKDEIAKLLMPLVNSAAKIHKTKMHDDNHFSYKNCKSIIQAKLAHIIETTTESKLNKLENHQVEKYFTVAFEHAFTDEFREIYGKKYSLGEQVSKLCKHIITTSIEPTERKELVRNIEEILGQSFNKEVTKENIKEYSKHLTEAIRTFTEYSKIPDQDKLDALLGDLKKKMGENYPLTDYDNIKESVHTEAFVDFIDPTDEDQQKSMAFSSNNKKEQLQILLDAEAEKMPERVTRELIRKKIFTKTEATVLGAVITAEAGKKKTEIAKEIGMKVTTLGYHLSSIRTKMVDPKNKKILKEIMNQEGYDTYNPIYR